MREELTRCEGIGGECAEEERHAHGSDCAMHRERGTWRACVYYRLQESPCVTEIELYSRNSTKQM